MAGKDTFSVRKYVVQLSAEKREHLQALIRKGKSPAKRLLNAHSVEGRCLGGRRRLERQPEHPGLVHDLPGTQATGGRGLRSGVEPQTAHDAARRCDFRRREGSQADRPGVLQAAEGARPLDVAPAGEQGRRTRHCRARKRLNDRAHTQKNVSSRIAGNARSSRRRPNSAFVGAMEMCWPSTRGRTRDLEATHCRDAHANPDEMRTCSPRQRAQWHRQAVHAVRAARHPADQC